MPKNIASTELGDKSAEGIARRHMLFGWWLLLLFLTVGASLEALHGFKVAWYLNVGQETRRLLWRLAHAHGTFLALVNIAFALTAARWAAGNQRRRGIASACLIGATIALPSGFFLGGLKVYGGDPGLGIWLTPLGVVLLFVAVLLTALEVTSGWLAQKEQKGQRRKHGT